MLRRNAASMSGREVFVQVTWDAIANVLWYGGAAVVITIVGKALWWWAGIIFFGIFVIVFLVSFLHTLIGTIMGIVLIPFAVYEKIQGRSVGAEEQLWLGAAQVIHLIEIAILASYTFWLYKVFF